MIDFSTETAITLLNSTDEHPVNFDDAWQWLGYSNKQAAKKKLTRNFEENEDYLTKWMNVPHSNGLTASRTEFIYLTVDCLKSLGMMAGTEKGKQIRKYFIECEKIAKQKPDALTELEGLAVAFTRMAEQERRALQQQKQLDQAEVRISAIECEQGRYMSPSGNKYTILGFANKNNLEISCATAATKGKAAASLCRKKEIVIEQTYDPRFGYVNLYPESVLIEVFN
jgi:phage anti-repressor protein